MGRSGLLGHPQRRLPPWSVPSRGAPPIGTPAYTCVVTRRFAIRTFGCQMNEHDSERLAGLLVADGMEPTDDIEQADVVVLNTCCIRENADNKPLRAPRPPEGAARRQARGCRSPSAAAWPRRTASWSASGPATSTWSSAPTTWPGPRRCCAGPRPSGPVVEVLDAPDPDGAADQPAPPSPPCASCPYAAWVTIQTGCDNSCAFCIVPSVRGAEVSRPFDELVDEVDGAGPPRRGRGHAARPERELLRPRPDPAPAALRRAAARPSGGVDGHPPGPLHQPAPQGPAPRDDRRHGGDRRRSASSSTCRCSRAATGCSRPCAAATRPSATSTGWPPPGPAIDDLAVTTDIIVGLPRRDRGRLRARPWPWWPRPATTAPTPSSSRPGPGTRAAAMDERVRARRGGGRALRAAPGGGRALGPAPPPGPRSAGPRRCWSRGRASATRRC